MNLARPLVVLGAFASLLSGQGITSAAILGTVTREDGTPISGAIVQVRNRSNGQRWQISTRANGVYNLENLSVGGPYRIDVRALGLAPAVRDSVVLPLGQRIRIDFTLSSVAIELQAVNVTADRRRTIDRTGPTDVISAARIANVPNQSRDFYSLLTLNPQVAISPSANQAPSGGITIAGQNRLLNALQIDGGVNHDLYSGRLPGRETLQRPIGLDAIEEIQLLVAPFDVRLGGFSGGLANAVTKSGTNTLQSSVFAFFSDGALVGKTSTGKGAERFSMWQYGGSVAGPIVHDRVHFFVSAELQRRMVPDPGPLISDTVGSADSVNIRVRYTSALRFQNLVRAFGMEPGSLGPVDRRLPANDVFGKISLFVSQNNRVEISNHLTSGNREGFVVRQSGRYLLSSQGNEQPVRESASRIIWTSLLGDRWLTELIASGLLSHDECQAFNALPLMQVRADQGLLIAGTAQNCPLRIKQRLFELTDNVTAQFGGHGVTAGVHWERLHVDDAQLQTSAGFWRFTSLDLLQQGTANHYERAVWAGPNVRRIDFGASNFAAYAQDRWQIGRALSVTLGLRTDIPTLPVTPTVNGPVESALSIPTGRLPRSALWSPRISVLYDFGPNGTVLHGGAGLFTGRLPYAWVASAYRGDGSHELFLSCDPPNVPSFNPVSQPLTCSNGTSAKQRLAFFDPNTRNPQNLKLVAGIEQTLPADVRATIDVIHTRARHQLYFADINLVAPTSFSKGEGNRTLYGTLTAAGVAKPLRRDTTFGQIVHMKDRGGDRSTTTSIHLTKRFGERAEMIASYSYTSARDRMSIVNFQSRINFETTPLDGMIADRSLTTSYFEVPHRLQLIATSRWGRSGTVSVLYAGASGTPYTWTIIGDANADGVGTGTQTNDAVYVPRDSADIALTVPAQWAVLDSVIRSDPCLKRQRGRILARNSCRNPWFGTVNLRATRTVASLGRHPFDVTADLYNAPNLLKRNWGQARVTTLNPGEPLLQLRGYDSAAGRGRYDVVATPSFIRQLQDLASRWQLQLGARYTL